ncbi:hypothetical protein EON65_40855, partial [archaeon]
MNGYIMCCAAYINTFHHASYTIHLTPYTMLIHTTHAPFLGQLGVVSRGRDWLSLPPQDICIEYIIAELYGDYQHSGRFN